MPLNKETKPKFLTNSTVQELYGNNFNLSQNQIFFFLNFNIMYSC